MVRECAVRLKELASSYISAQSFKNVGSIETSDSVACIDNKLKAFQRVLIVAFVIDLSLYEFTQIACVVSHVFVLDDLAAAGIVGLVAVLRIFQYSGDIAALKTALTGKELETVPVIRMMACSDLDSTVTAKLYCSHEHCGSRAHSAVDNAYACRNKSLLCYLCYLRA